MAIISKNAEVELSEECRNGDYVVRLYRVVLRLRDGGTHWLYVVTVMNQKFGFEHVLGMGSDRVGAYMHASTRALYDIGLDPVRPCWADPW